MLWYPAGSRDPEANADPQRFDVTRAEPTHMAFGGGGRHFCLGAGLARLELRVAFEEILRRLDGRPACRRAAAAALELGQRPHLTSNRIHASQQGAELTP